MRDPRTLDDAQLEEVVRQAGFKRHDADLFVKEVEGDGWTAEFKSFPDPSDLAPTGAILQGVAGAASKRDALEALFHGLELADELDRRAQNVDRFG